MSQRFSLSTMQINLMIAILNKLPAKDLIRMRQTCHMMDNLVGENDKKFASRPHLGIDLYIECGLNSGMRFYYQYNLDPSPGTADDGTKLIGTEWGAGVKKKLSGISTKTLELLCDESDDCTPKMVQFLEDFQPICLQLTNCTINQNYIAQFMNLISIVDPSEINLSINLPETSAEKDRLYTDLANIKYSSYFSLSSSRITRQLEARVFEKAMPFSSLGAPVTLKAFHELLWDIYNYNESIPFKSLSVQTVLPNMAFATFPFTSAPMPPITTLQQTAFHQGINVGKHEMILRSQKVAIKEQHIPMAHVVFIEMDICNLN